MSDSLVLPDSLEMSGGYVSSAVGLAFQLKDNEIGGRWLSTMTLKHNLDHCFLTDRYVRIVNVKIIGDAAISRNKRGIKIVERQSRLSISV